MEQGNNSTELRRLGKTEIMISPLGLGCWQFSRGRGLFGRYWDDLAAEEIEEIVSASLRGGMSWFDTAEAYGWGRSEQALRDALRELEVSPGKVVVATKWFPGLRTARNIERTFSNRQRALQEYPVDLYQIHAPGSFSSVAAQMEAMARLVDSGLIKAAGVSNFSAAQMEEAHRVLEGYGIPLASNQVRYSLLDRRIEAGGLLDTARELGITIIAYSPLAQGILTGKYHENPGLIRKKAGPRKFMRSFKSGDLERTAPVVEALRGIGEARGATAAQVALSWVVRFHGGVVVAVAGASNRRQAAQNAGAQQIRLSADELDLLDGISREVVSQGRPSAGPL